MKLIEKPVAGSDGQDLRWHAITGIDVDLQARCMLVTFGSWPDQEQAKSRLRPVQSGVLEVYFQQWDEHMLYAAPDILVSSGDLAGGVVVDLTQQPIEPEPPTVARVFADQPSDEVFDVGAMP